MDDIFSKIESERKREREKERKRERVFKQRQKGNISTEKIVIVFF